MLFRSIILILQSTNSDWTTWDESHLDWCIEDTPPNKGFEISDSNLLSIYRWVGEEFGIAFGIEASRLKRKVEDKPPTSPPKAKKSHESMRVRRVKGEKEAMVSEENVESGDGNGDGNSGVDVEEEYDGQVGKVIERGKQRKGTKGEKGTKVKEIKKEKMLEKAKEKVKAKVKKEERSVKVGKEDIDLRGSVEEHDDGLDRGESIEEVEKGITEKGKGKGKGKEREEIGVIKRATRGMTRKAGM